MAAQQCDEVNLPVSETDFTMEDDVGIISALLGAAVASKFDCGEDPTVGDYTSESNAARRNTIETVVAAGAGALGAGLTGFVKSVVESGKLKKTKFVDVMKLYKVGESNTADRLWKLLCDNKIVVNEVVKIPGPDWALQLEFPKDLECYRGMVKTIVESSCAFSLEHILKATIRGTVLGGLSGITLAGFLREQEKQKIAEQSQSRGEQVKRGSAGGSIETAAYAKLFNKYLIIHHEDGNSIKKYGSPSDEEIHIWYNGYHYYNKSADQVAAADIGKEYSEDCLFETLAEHTPGENANTIREKVGKLITDRVDMLPLTKLDELATGGYDLGAGNISKAECTKALQEVKEGLMDKKLEIPPEIQQIMLRNFKKLLDDLGRIKEEQITQLLETPNKYRIGRYCFHGLQDHLYRCIAGDVVDPRARDLRHSRGKYRVVFRVTRRGIKFVKFLTNHEYDQIQL